jgi:hypothetical protein
VSLDREAAATIGLRALAHVAADPEHLQKLMDSSGLSIDELRRRAADPSLLAGVLDYLLADEAALLVFCEHAGLAPDLPARARAALP